MSVPAQEGRPYPLENWRLVNCLPSRETRALLKTALAVAPGAVHWWPARPVEARHRYLLGMVFQRLNQEQYQGPELEELRKIQLSILWRHRRLEKAARQALDVLEGGGIRAVLLKGLALLCCLQAPVTRSLADFDVLIESECLDTAARLLEVHGWVAEQDLPDLARRKITHGMSWRKDGLSLDLHWQWMPESLNPELDGQVRRRAQTVLLLGQPALALDATDLLLHTVVHGCKSGSGDGWVLDLCLLLQSIQPDWARFLDQAQLRRTVLPCRVGLEFLAQEMRAPVPGAVLRTLRKLSVSRLDRLYFFLKGNRRRVWSLWLWPILEYLRLPACQRPQGFLAYLRLRWRVQGSLWSEAWRRLGAYLSGSNG